MYISRFQASIFCLLVILPLVIALALLEKRVVVLERALDGAVQGLIIHHPE